MNNHMKKDLTGKRFGKLVAIKPTKNRHRGCIVWLCKCDCGGEGYFSSGLLNQGGNKSCGCLKRKRKGVSAQNRVIRGYKRGAKKRGYEWLLTKKQFLEICSMDCFYCGSPPSNKCNSKWNGSFEYNGIDRVDNSKGYSVDNAVPCCETCNTMKSTLSAKEFAEHIERIHLVFCSPGLLR